MDAQRGSGDFVSGDVFGESYTPVFSVDVMRLKN